MNYKYSIKDKKKQIKSYLMTKIPKNHFRKIFYKVNTNKQIFSIIQMNNLMIIIWRHHIEILKILMIYYVIHNSKKESFQIKIKKKFRSKIKIQYQKNNKRNKNNKSMMYN